MHQLTSTPSHMTIVFSTTTIGTSMPIALRKGTLTPCTASIPRGYWAHQEKTSRITRFLPMLTSGLRRLLTTRTNTKLMAWSWNPHRRNRDSNALRPRNVTERTINTKSTSKIDIMPSRSSSRAQQRGTSPPPSILLFQRSAILKRRSNISLGSRC